MVTTLQPKSDITFKDQHGNDVDLRNGQTVTFDISNLSPEGQEETLSTIAYYGYLAAEGEPYDDGIPRVKKEAFIKLRLRPSNHQKSETHKVTMRDVQENGLLDLLTGKSAGYYIKIRYS